jgi:hypothetical protein
MKISRIIATLCAVALGVLLTTKAYGNFVIPSLTQIAVFSVKTILPILIGVIIIEAIVLKMYLPTITWLDAFKSTTLSNLLSTVVGVPVTVIFAIGIEFMPSLITNATLAWMLYIFLVFVPCFFVSSIIEEGINKTILMPTISARNVQNATWLANVISYTFLYILTIANHISK